MADIAFECPHCMQHLEAPDDMAGTSVECPACGKSIAVPSVVIRDSAIPVSAPQNTPLGRSGLQPAVPSAEQLHQHGDHSIAANTSTHRRLIVICGTVAVLLLLVVMASIQPHRGRRYGAPDIQAPNQENAGNAGRYVFGPRRQTVDSGIAKTSPTRTIEDATAVTSTHISSIAESYIYHQGYFVGGVQRAAQQVGEHVSGKAEERELTSNERTLSLIAMSVGDAPSEDLLHSKFSHVPQKLVKLLKKGVDDGRARRSAALPSPSELVRNADDVTKAMGRCMRECAAGNFPIEMEWLASRYAQVFALERPDLLVDSSVDASLDEFSSVADKQRSQDRRRRALVAAITQTLAAKLKDLPMPHRVVLAGDESDYSDNTVPSHVIRLRVPVRYRTWENAGPIPISFRTWTRVERASHGTISDTEDAGMLHLTGVSPYGKNSLLHYLSSMQSAIAGEVPCLSVQKQDTQVNVTLPWIFGSTAKLIKDAGSEMSVEVDVAISLTFTLGFHKGTAYEAQRLKLESKLDIFYEETLRSTDASVIVCHFARGGNFTRTSTEDIETLVSFVARKGVAPGRSRPKNQLTAHSLATSDADVLPSGVLTNAAVYETWVKAEQDLVLRQQRVDFIEEVRRIAGWWEVPKIEVISWQEYRAKQPTGCDLAAAYREYWSDIWVPAAEATARTVKQRPKPVAADDAVRPEFPMSILSPATDAVAEDEPTESVPTDVFGWARWAYARGNLALQRQRLNFWHQYEETVRVTVPRPPFDRPLWEEYQSLLPRGDNAEHIGRDNFYPRIALGPSNADPRLILFPRGVARRKDKQAAAVAAGYTAFVRTNEAARARWVFAQGDPWLQQQRLAWWFVYEWAEDPHANQDFYSSAIRYYDSRRYSYRSVGYGADPGDEAPLMVPEGRR